MGKNLFEFYSASIIIEGKSGKQIKLDLRNTSTLNQVERNKKILIVTKDVQFYSGILYDFNIEKDFICIEDAGNDILGKVSDLLGWTYSDEITILSK